MKTLQQEEVVYEVFEFVEFQVGKSNFGIPISQVREIIQPVPVTVLPHAHPFVEGIIQLRGEVLPVLDLKKAMGHQVNSEEDTKYIVAEFDEKTIVFDVSAVTQIQRCKFNEIEPATEMYEGDKIPVTGVIKRESNMVLLIDFDKFIADQMK